MPEYPPRPAVPAENLTTPLGDPASTNGGTNTAGPAAETLPPSRAARYVLGEEIARGGMGVVYRATDTVLGREVAVKVLQENLGPASAAARRFADEARISGQLQHPAIPPVHDLGSLPDGRPLLAMKLIKGDTLDQLLKARTDPTQDRGRFVAAFEQVCQALAYAHAHGVIHRDLKPANIMVGSFGEVQVMDWGLAKVLTGRPAGTVDPEETTAGTAIRSLRDSDGSETQAGSILGTPAFMPPEQAIGAVGKVDTRSDVFGLGAILTVVLTGKPPFVGGSVETTRLQAATGRLDECFARLDGSGADPDLVSLARRCLAPDPAQRPADAGEVAQAVAGWRAAAEDRARRAELDRATAEVQATEQRKRRRVFAVAGTVLVGVLAAGILGTSVGLVRAEGALTAEADQRSRAEQALAAEADQRTRAEQARDALADALKAEAKARKEAEESYQLAREAVVGIAWDIPDILRQAVFAREAEKKVTATLAEVMEKQLALTNTRNLPDRAAHAIHLRLGDLLVLQARYNDAQLQYEAALAVSGRVLAAEVRAKDRAKVDHAASHQKLGSLGVTRGFVGGPEKVFDYFLKADALCREVVTAPTTGELDPAEARFLLAAAVHDTARARERRQEYGQAATACEEAAALLEEVLKAKPARATAGAAARLADVRILLGEVEFKRGRNVEAEAAMRAATRAYDAEVAGDGYDLDLRKRAAQANRAAGDLLLFLHRYEDARPFHARDVQLCRGLIRMPEIVAAQAELSYAHYRSGTLALKRGDPAAAQFYYRRCVLLREEMVAAQPNNESSRLALARALARAGDHLGAIAAFEPARRRQVGTLNVATQQAVVYGLCAAALRAGRRPAELAEDERAVYDQYLDEAFAGLDQAVTDWDWLDIVGLKTDPDFDPLRDDPRFGMAVKKVEERIAARAPKPVAPAPREK